MRMLTLRRVVSRLMPVALAIELTLQRASLSGVIAVASAFSSGLSSVRSRRSELIATTATRIIALS